MSPLEPAIKKREDRSLELRVECEKAKHADDARSAAITRRDAMLAKFQGPPSEGGFSYSELAKITGLSRTRVTQIIRDVRST